MRVQICLNKLPRNNPSIPHKLSICGLNIAVNFSKELNFSIFI